MTIITLTLFHTIPRRESSDKIGTVQRRSMASAHRITRTNREMCQSPKASSIIVIKVLSYYDSYCWGPLWSREPEPRMSQSER